METSAVVRLQVAHPQGHHGVGEGEQKWWSGLARQMGLGELPWAWCEQWMIFCVPEGGSLKESRKPPRCEDATVSTNEGDPGQLATTDSLGWWQRKEEISQGPSGDANPQTHLCRKMWGELWHDCRVVKWRFGRQMHILGFLFLK